MPPLVRRKEAQGKSVRQRLTTVASRRRSLFLNLSLCFGASGWQRRYIKPNSASKKEAGRWLLASAKVERATGFSPPGERRFIRGFRVGAPSRTPAPGR